MKKKVLLLIALLLPLMVNAQICVDDIYYAETDDGNYKVTKNPDGYSGEITIPSIVNGRKVTEIDDRAFANNSKVTAIHLPITIEKIGVAAFCICENISTIEIPDKVNRIAEYAFGGNPNLCDVYCYSPQVVIGERLFYATKVKNITLHVPEANINYFKKADQWKKIKNIVPTTEESWAMKQHKHEIAEARQKQIQDSIAKVAAREKQIKDSIEAKQKLDADIAAAKNGDVEAMYRLGVRYTDGDGVAKDMNQAITYFKQAADSGYVKSQVYLGSLYYKGYGVDKDINKALPYFKKAVDQGDATAQMYLGLIYYNGDGVKKDEKTALSWFDKSAAQGNEYAIDFIKKYQKEHSSSWTDNYIWRIVFPDGVIVTATGYDSNDRYIKTNNFEIYRAEALGEEQFKKVVSQEEKITVFGDYFKIYPINIVAFIDLSNKERTDLLKKELSHFKPAMSWVETVLVDDLGQFKDGKYFSNDALAQEKQKRLKATVASYTKRLGFDPSTKSIKQLISAGRPFSLINDYLNEFYVDGNNYYFSFAEDTGISKGYRIIKNRKRVGIIYVQNGRIISVRWF